MKKYENPEIEIEEFDVEDVVTTSEPPMMGDSCIS